MKGISYIRWWGFSIREGLVPNLHVSWREAGEWGLYIYLRTQRWRCMWRPKAWTGKRWVRELA